MVQARCYRGHRVRSGPLGRLWGRRSAGGLGGLLWGARGSDGASRVPRDLPLDGEVMGWWGGAVVRGEEGVGGDGAVEMVLLQTATGCGF